MKITGKLEDQHQCSGFGYKIRNVIYEIYKQYGPK